MGCVMVGFFERFFRVFSFFRRCWDIDNFFGAFFGGVILVFTVVMLFVYLVRSFR